MGKIVYRSVFIGDRELKYKLEIKPVKNLNLRIKQDGKIYVSANKRVSFDEIDKFIISKSEFIFSAIDKFLELRKNIPPEKNYIDGEIFYLKGEALKLCVISSEKNSVYADEEFLYLETREPQNLTYKQKLVDKFFDEQCRKIFGEILEEIYPLFSDYNFKMPEFRIRKMRTRWGSCAVYKSVITLNKRLVEAPVECIKYVVLHELCHLVYADHSKNFYNLLSSFMPNWKELKILLEKSVIF